MLKRSIAEAFKMMRSQVPVEIHSKIERKFGYDVIDHKNYNELEPEKQSGIDFLTSTKTSNVALIPVLAKIEQKILSLEYFKLNNHLSSALGEVLSNCVPSKVSKLLFTSNDMSD